MKKVLIITNIISLLVLVFFFVFAQLKANEAAENAIIAQENAKEAEIQREAAVEQARLARAAQAEAERQRQIAEDLQEQLEQCKK